MADSETTSLGKAVGKTSSQSFPWIAHYPEGLDWDHEFEILSLPEMFETSVQKYGSRVCSNFKGKTLSYAEIGRQTDKFAAGLQKSGIGRGHRVGLFLPNCPYYPIAYFALLKIGAVVVNFNPLYTIEEIEMQVHDAGLSAMVTLDLSLLADKILNLTERGLISQTVICPFAQVLPWHLGLLFKLFKKSEVTQVAAGSYGKGEILSYEALCNNAGEFAPAIIKPMEDTALFQYTGGTTGIPKAAMLSHANLTINVQQVVNWMPEGMLPDPAKTLAILPFFHVFANTTVLNFGIYMGAEIIMMPRFDLDEAITLIRKHRPHALPGVPTLYNALLNSGKLDASDMSSLKCCVSGGAPLPLEVRTRFEKEAGCALVEGYGLSETAPVATTNPYVGLRKDNSIGQPMQQTVLSIRSLEDPAKEMPLGEPGEICIKGPQVMQGYWNKPEENDMVFVGEFFRTGDVGYMDEFGFTYIIDRIKDMINCSGFKVYPRRIEDAVYQHEAVEEVTVIGIPDEYRGEAPKAFIKLKEGHTLTADDIFAHLQPKLSKIEMPEEIEFRDELPKTMVGKLSKKELR